MSGLPLLEPRGRTAQSINPRNPSAGAAIPSIDILQIIF